MIENSSYDVILSYLPADIRECFRKISFSDRQFLSEIRLRIGRPICFVSPYGTRYMEKSGHLSYSFSDSKSYMVTRHNIDEIVRALCKYSVHSSSRELSEGFFTLAKGVRVGVAGIRTKNDDAIKYVSSLNFRIAREVIGCGEDIYKNIFSHGPVSIIICGGANSGKTTLLRDLCRISGNACKTVLIDERNEISAVCMGEPEMDVGLQTDILSGYERAAGIISAIRTLSPHIIFCDEICKTSDSEAILSSYGCGVRIAATIHAENINDLQSREVMKPLLDAGVFEYAIFMEGENFPGKIREYRRLG